MIITNFGLYLCYKCLMHLKWVSCHFHGGEFLWIAWTWNIFVWLNLLWSSSFTNSYKYYFGVSQGKYNVEFLAILNFFLFHLYYCVYLKYNFFSLIWHMSCNIQDLGQIRENLFMFASFYDHTDFMSVFCSCIFIFYEPFGVKITTPPKKLLYLCWLLAKYKWLIVLIETF